MFKVCLFSTLLAVTVHANGYASGGGYGELPTSSGLLSQSFLGGGLVGAAAPLSAASLSTAPLATAPLSYGGGQFLGAPLAAAPFIPAALPVAPAVNGPLAVISKQNVQVVPVQSIGIPQPQRIFMDSVSAPVQLIARSFSSPIRIAHQHVPQRGTFRATVSQDEPQRHMHTVTKPVIQEIREIITPVRIIRKDVQPVREEVLTNVPRAIQQVAAPVFAAPAAGSLESLPLDAGGLLDAGCGRLATLGGGCGGAGAVLSGPGTAVLGGAGQGAEYKRK